MRSAPTWYPKAAQLLASGKPQKEVAAALGIWPKTLRRHIARPDGLLRAQVEAERAKQAAQVDDELAPLRGKALAVLEKALDSGDVGAAKALLSKLVASPADAPPQEAEPEPEISEDDAGREMALAFPAVADLARIGKLSTEVVEMLRAACRAFLADDLKPQPPVDVEAEKVNPVPAEPTSGFRPGAGDTGTIPIR